MKKEEPEFKDRIYCSTRVYFSFWQRVINLFVPEMVVEHEIEVSEKIERHRTTFNMRGYTYFQKIRRALRRKPVLVQRESSTNYGDNTNLN